MAAWTTERARVGGIGLEWSLLATTTPNPADCEVVKMKARRLLVALTAISSAALVRSSEEPYPHVRPEDRFERTLELYHRALAVQAEFDTSSGNDGRALDVSGKTSSAPAPAGPASSAVMQATFKQIIETDWWAQWGGDPGSKCGPGSAREATAPLRTQLLDILSRHEIHTLVDAGVGDFNWMRLLVPELEARLEWYLGIDIVPSLVEANTAEFGSPKVRFEHADVCAVGTMPRADLVYAKEIMFHLPIRNIMQMIENIRASGSRLLLATIIREDGDGNRDVQPGQWFPLDLTKPPFGFPEPIECHAWPGQTAEHCLWRVEDLPTFDKR
jgi:hypothetical protein